VGTAYMGPGSLGVGEQGGYRTPMARSEGIHPWPDLVAILEIRVRDVQLHVADALDVSRFLLPAARPQEVFDSLLELLVFLQQLLDASHQMLGLRLERARRVLELPLELTDQGVRPRAGHGFDAPHSRRGPRFVGEPEQRDLPGARHMGAAAQLES